MGRSVLPGPNPGLLVKGTIDIFARPVVLLKNGDVATVASRSSGIDGDDAHKLGVRRPGVVEMLYPTVVGNRIVSGKAAESHALSTGLHLGIFDNARNATSYAIRLHNEQARFYKTKIRKVRSKAGLR